MTVEATIEELRARPGEGETIPIIDPVTEQEIAEFVDGGAAAIDDAVARARETFDSGVWHQLPHTERAQVLWRVAELLEAAGRRTGPDRLAEHGYAVATGRAQHCCGRGILPLLLWLVHEDQRNRPRRADVGRTLRNRGVGPCVHHQRACRCRRTDHPLERSSVQRRRQARPVTGGGVQQRAQAGRGDPAVGTGIRERPGRSRGTRWRRQLGQWLWTHSRASSYRAPRRRQDRLYGIH